MSDRHTPGPWTHGRPNGYGGDLVCAGNSAVASIYGLPLHHRVDEIHGDRNAEGLANARLIASAPAMLEALRAAEGHLAETLTDPKWHPIGHCPVLDLVRAAITQATGSRP